MPITPNNNTGTDGIKDFFEYKLTMLAELIMVTMVYVMGKYKIL